MKMYNKVIMAIAHRDFDIRFVGRHDWDGKYDWDGQISISIHAPLPVSVLIHEVLHVLYPNRSEKWVLEHEAKLYSQLTDKDRKYLVRVLAGAKRRYNRRRK